MLVKARRLACLRLAFFFGRLAVPLRGAVEGTPFLSPRTTRRNNQGDETVQRVNLTDKKCATCRWWQGERGIQFWNKKPFKVECDAKGDCMSIKAPKPYSSSCPRWVAWEKLP